MNKILATLLFTFTFFACWAANLPVNIDMNRFFNEKHQTKFEINYQVKYNNLSFVGFQKGYFADLTVKIEILKSDSVITQKEFTNKIGVSSQNDAESEQKSFMDKISLVLSGKSYKIRITFTDPKSTNSKTWVKDLIELPVDRSLSDIELSKSIATADTTRYMEKFRRNNKIYLVEPSHVFYPALQDSMYIYYQMFGPTNGTGGSISFEMEYRLLKDKTILRSWETSTQSTSSLTNIQTCISLKDLPYGLLDLKIIRKSGSKPDTVTTFFSLGEIKEDFISILPKIAEEISLLKYFYPKSKLSSLDVLSNDGKKRMTTQLWISLAAEENQPVLQWTTLIKNRISYANKFYSHFKPGWESDMGRIYIRMGVPDDISKRVTSDDTKFVQKDYQIWKYTKSGRSYVFIDIQMNGNYKMIYAKNDEKENSQADWQRYLGKNFQEEDLEKDSSYPTE